MNMTMLRIAVQSKGRLYEETMQLLEESDIKLSTSKRTLLVQASNFPVSPWRCSSSGTTTSPRP